MKTSYFAITFIFIALLIIPTTYAHGIDDCNLTIPDGYYIKNTTDNFIELEDENHTSISISLIENSTDIDTLKYMLEGLAYDFRTSDNYTKGNFSIEEDFYTQEYQSGLIYFCDDGCDLIVIDYKTALTDEITDSPVDPILDALCE